MRFTRHHLPTGRLLAVLVLLAVASAAQAAQPGAPTPESFLVKGPYVQNVTLDGITICWQTADPAPGAVEYGASQSLGSKVESPELAVRHEVRLGELAADTKYFYRVRAGDVTTPTYRFSTAKPHGAPVRIAILGDTRSRHDVHRKVVEAIIAWEPDIVLNSGDLVGNGLNDDDWTEFFKVTGDLIHTVPYYPCLGNHERNSPLYFNYFALPGNERYYSFDYGDVHIIALDSDEPFRSWNKQTEWLYDDLNKAEDNLFTIAFFHHPPYAATASLGRRMGGRDLREKFCPYLEEYGVDLVANGHDHNYARTFVNGVHYIVTGGGGAPTYAVRPKWGFVTEAVEHWLQMEVNGSNAHVRVVRIDGSVIEEFDIQSLRADYVAARRAKAAAQ